MSHRDDDNTPRCARCHRGLGEKDSPLSCSVCNREDAAREAVSDGVATGETVSPKKQL